MENVFLIARHLSWQTRSGSEGAQPGTWLTERSGNQLDAGDSSACPQLPHRDRGQEKDYHREREVMSENSARGLGRTT